MDDATEKAFFFENEGKRLFGVLHTPPRSGTGRAIVFCDPYGEEKQIVHRILVTLARRLYDSGVCVLRFDYRGYGDSEGEFEEADVSSQLSDIARAVTLLMDQQGVRHVGLLGVRLGGTLAALAAAGDRRIEFLALCAPVLRPKEYFDGLVRRAILAELMSKGRRVSREAMMAQLNSDGFMELDGHRLSQRAYGQFSAVDLAEPARQIQGDVFMVAMTGDHDGVDGYVEALSAVCSAWGSRCELKILQEAPFWDPVSFERWAFPRTFSRELVAWLRSRGIAPGLEAQIHGEAGQLQE